MTKNIIRGVVMRGGSKLYGPDVVRSGLIAFLDPANYSSYPGTGTTITDLSGQGATGTINGTISYVSDNLASYWNFTQSDSNYISSSLSQGYVDCTIAFKPDFSLVSASSGLVGLLSNNTNGSRADKSLRFQNVDGTGPWQIKNPGDSNDWASSTGGATTYYLNGVALSGTNATILDSWCIIGAYKTSGSFGSTWSYYLGASGWPGRGFQGRLGVVLLYNRQLTAAEQITNYNALRKRYGI